MTVDVVRRPRRRTTGAGSAPEPTIAPAASIAIGELDQTVFDCPSCSRPLALGARRCPGCGTLLVNGVTLGKASIFVSVGLAIGLTVGGGGGLLLGLSAAPAAIATTPSAAPAASSGAGSSAAAGASAPPTASGAVPTPPSGLPPVARSALIQAVATNGRLVLGGTNLRAALAAHAFDASAVAQVLRTLSSDSLYGEQLAARIGGTSATADVGTRLSAFYGAIHDTAATGLVASVQNEAVYRSAAREMLTILDGMDAIDAALRSTAASAGIDLPSASAAPTAP